MRKIKAYLLVSTIILCLSPTLLAGPNTSIWYEIADLGAGCWKYTYTVFNLENSLIPEIEEFTIWFNYDKYDNLLVATDPQDYYDEIVWQPDSPLEDDGGYNVRAASDIPILTPGIPVHGFSVSFDWLGSGEPGSQYYEIINPDTFETIEDGYTTPEPATLLLLGLGGLGLISKRRV